MITQMIIVGFGGAFGAMGRFALNQALPAEGAVPWSTFTANILGSFLIGVLFILTARWGDPRLNLLLGTGVLGGFTTYSSFSLETVRLLQAEQFGQAGMYAFGTLVSAVVAAGLGIWVMQRVLG